MCRNTFSAAVGIELSQMFAKFGAKISIVEGTSTILPTYDAQSVHLVSRKLKKLDIYTDALARSVNVTDTYVTLTFKH